MYGLSNLESKNFWIFCNVKAQHCTNKEHIKSTKVVILNYQKLSVTDKFTKENITIQLIIVNTICI